MSIIYSFFDNQTIGVDELNKITSRLMSEGIVREPSSVEDLNNFVSDVATTGVVPETVESLKVTAQNGVLTINKGTAIFQNGTVIQLTEAETMPYLTNEKQYVYLISDMSANKAYADVLSGEAEFENKILLAEIENGEVSDKRMYSRGKLAYYGSADINNNVFLEEDNIEEKYEKDDEGYINYKIDINADMYKYLQIFDKNSFNFTRYNINDGTFLSFGYGLNSYYTLNESYMVAASQVKKRCRCVIEKGEGYITLRLKMEYLQDKIPISLRIEFIA